MNDDPPDAIDMIGQCMTWQNPNIGAEYFPENTMRTEDIRASTESLPEEIFIPEELPEETVSQ